MHMTPQQCLDGGLDHPSCRLFAGFDVGKSFHHAHAAGAEGRTVPSLKVGSLDSAVDSFPRRALERSGADPAPALVVVDQRRSVGTTVVRRARAAGRGVAYVAGRREKRARELSPGVAKNGAEDAEVIACAARGMPQSLPPVPGEGDGMEGARRPRSQLSFTVKQATQCRNRIRAQPVESNAAFERAVDLSKAWQPGLLEEPGGPWQMPGAGREALSAAAPGAPEEEPGRLWLALSQAARPTDEQVRGEAATFPMLARRTRALDEDARELSGLLCAEVEGDEAHRRLPTVPGVGGATAAQLVASVRIGSFPDHDRLASYCGISPRDAQSGTTPSSVSSSPEGNKALKNLLVFSCLSLVGGGTGFGVHYRRCRSRGMRHAAALKATARKRLKVIYAVMRGRRPYSPPA